MRVTLARDMTRKSAYRGVVSIPGARALIGASAASELGNWLYNAALLAYVYSVTHSAAWVGAATICRLLPYVLLGPLAGAIADRYPRRTVLLVGNSVSLAIMVGLAAVVASSGPVVVVIASAALSSAAGCAERPAALALLPRLVGETRLGAANALLHTAQNLGILIGPAIGAILLATAPAWAPFAANGVTFAVAAGLVSTLRADSAPVGGRATVISPLAGALSAIRATPFSVWLIVAVSTVEFTYGSQTVQLVVYARHSLGLGRGGYGVLLSAVGAGGIMSAFVTARLSRSRRVSLIVVVTAVVACATQLAYAGTTVVGIALSVAVVGAAALVSCEVVGETVLARIAPRDALGRLVGAFDAASVAAMVAGAVLAPVLIAATSLRDSMLLLGGGAILVTMLCAVRLRGLDVFNQERTDALATRVKALEGIPITVGVPQIVLEQLAMAGQFCALPPGVDIVVQGAPAHAFYVVVEGRVVVRREGKARAHLGPGDNFGERGLLDNAPRNATVTTETESKLLRIEGRALLDALEAAPALRPALDLSNGSSGIAVPAGETLLVDDPGWVRA